jgi:hypothetical protein
VILALILLSVGLLRCELRRPATFASAKAEKSGQT